MGDLRMRRGDGELEAEQFNQACDSYLTATEYYWLALTGGSLREAERRVLADAQVSAFRSAIPLLRHPATPLDLVVHRPVRWSEAPTMPFLPPGVVQF